MSCLVAAQKGRLGVSIPPDLPTWPIFTAALD